MSMEYKGYSASIEFDADDELFYGEVDGISDDIIFYADNVQELKNRFHSCVDFYLESCAKLGKQPQRPSSETMQIRFAASVSSAAHAAAARAGQSISDWLQALAARETGVAL